MMTCSPDSRRYKEFRKKGGVMYYMSTWKLKELLLVGRYFDEHHQKLDVSFSPEAINDRYDRFGGIFQYVFPGSNENFETAVKLQESAIKKTELVDAFAPYASIEKTDSNEKNISHFILHYNMQCNGEGGDFKEFKMVLASEYVKEILSESEMQDDKLYRIIQSLRDMFIDLPQVPELFEMVVYHSVVSQHFNWQVYKNEIWVDHKWGLSKNRKLRKNNEMVTEMEKGVLYKPVDLQFPAVDFVYMENLQKDLTRKTVYCIQVTFSSSHQKQLKPIRNYTIGLE